MKLQIDDLLLALREGSAPFPCHDGWCINYYELKLVLAWDPEQSCWKVTTELNGEE